ncbi:murein biosynthesis integral membrane protein MurJ [Glycomyces harbinensis]|uniref:Putative peptidoglycan lipid II flippase n=1 Tax=Glycomyces harbinensis TaxID=58114 RepID=A0A1G6ZP03_9ACTN|nr:lipid II flippase MurJ [Glycomyces harbinensis]SDE04514.1 putative peptidoglycan lipid II flippase [Glycomyces harbinensis]
MTETRREVGRAASVIGAITVASRLAGFGRTMVFTWAIGLGTLGTAYQTANNIPNIIFELVAGGALAALVIPLLAAPLARHDPRQVGHIASALLTWALTILVPAGLLLAFFARPIILLLMPANVDSGKTIDVATEMLVLFAPQLPLYGVAVVLTGILQSHRRFAWPALAPLLSSVVMAGVYVVYGMISGREDKAGQVSQNEVLLLGLGTTCGVAVLAGCLIFPLRGLRLKLRPAWRLETHVAAGLRSLAIAGMITVGAQQLCQALLIRLANDAGEEVPGATAIFTVSQTFFLLPWAILAVPLATAAYPILAEAFSLGEHERYQRRLSQTGRAVLLLSGLGVAALAGLAEPMGTVLASVSSDTGLSTQPQLQATLTGLAFGLFGYSVFAIYSRGLYAIGRNKYAAGATSLGWAAGAAAALVLSAAMPLEDRTLALAIAWSVGMTVIGLALTAAIARHTGAASLRGVPRAALATIVAAVGAVLAARELIALWGHADTFYTALFQGAVVGAAIAVVYLGLAALLGGSGVVRPVLRRAGIIRASEEPDESAPDEPSGADK